MAYSVSIKNKSCDSMVQAFTELLQKAGLLLKLQTDRGTEFANKKLQTFSKWQNIKHSHNFDTKASVVERFIRTLKGKLWRCFTHRNSRNHLNVLPQLLESCNQNFFTSIDRTASVITDNPEEVFQILYAESKAYSLQLNLVILCV